MSSKGNSVFTAAQAIGEALQGLNEEQQQRALDGARVMLGLASPPLDGEDDTGDEGTNTDKGGKGRQPQGSGRQQSLIEYSKEKKPATNAQRIAVFAAYREDVEQLQTFSKDDLKKYFSKARLTVPGNYPRDYGEAVKAGWIHDEDSDSYLTQTGQDAVSSGFDGKAAPRGRASKKTRKSKR